MTLLVVSSDFCASIYTVGLREVFTERKRVEVVIN